MIFIHILYSLFLEIIKLILPNKLETTLPGFKSLFPHRRVDDFSLFLEHMVLISGDLRFAYGVINAKYEPA